ncbi:hypothetical protein Mgra_00005942 [Meloidogyne graminicola]|uniref:Cubilin n=1 Tax=Meloidogyne graminicola TaxID=189291 RepID=A0A8S9ZMS8_9BILA|nr:hypothetical protein Mgra_00005942 [Meloidogyne graminicola]
MLFINGNIFFIAGLGKNISFHVSSDSSIKFGNTNILDLPNSTEINLVKNLLLNTNEKMIGLETTLEITNSELENKINDLIQKNLILTKQINGYTNDTYQRAKTNRRSRILILRLTKQIERLFKLMATDECLILGNDACKNGGICIDGFGKFQCLCPSHFEGKHCELRIDECSLYSGTSIGCQNGAKCTNNPTIAGFSCNCTNGWHGILCEHSKNICDNTDNICGIHGHCIQSKSSQSALTYKCICEQGYQQGGDPNNPICIDIDECSINNPCYPGTECINIPGSFKCGSCPSGLIGNGLHCLDFDECENDLTNDCSKQPLVDCINIHGSYKCSECPIGYISKGEKQGQICQKIDICNNSPLINGGCSSIAKCISEPEFRCICPTGMIGNGIGPDGCENPKILNGTDVNLCVNNGEDKSCLNGGICQAISLSEIRCLCPETYFGVRCEHPTPCLSRQFCSGHGHCQSNPLVCLCFKGFYGPRCQFQEDGGCGFHTSNDTGELIYERTSPSPLFVRWTCTWYIQMFDTRKILQINFLNFTAPRLFEITSKGCENAFVTLTIYDGSDPTKSPTLASKQIANLCHGKDFENPFKYPIFTSTNKAVIRLSSRIQGRNTYLHLKWTAKQPSCGGRFSNPNGGRIDYYFNYLENKEEIGEEKACIWYINVPIQFHIELNLQVLRLPSDEIVNCSINKLEIFDSQMPSNRTLSVQLCSSLATKELPNIIRTSGPFATIYLKINEKQLNKNCKSSSLCTSIVPNGCGGKIITEETSSLLQSPNYPHIYFPNLDFEILFEHFDIPTTITQYANPLLRHLTMNSCYGDFLQIVEKELTYCNMNKPLFNLPIVEPLISLKFHSDNSIGGSGFSIRYRSICQKDFILPNGTIFPPNFPEASPKPFKCKYRIIAKPNQAIRLRFDKIGFTTSFGKCFQNNREKNLEIQDYVFNGGHSSNEVANKRYICPRYPFVAPGGEMVTSGIKPFIITYSTSGSLTNKGFLFSYETFDIGCGGIYTINNEQKFIIITSPNYPEPYLSFMYCVYFLNVPIGKALRLSFDVFDIENVAHRDDCDFDNVRIFDSYIDDNEHGQLLGKFCGKALPPPIISNSGQMAVVFISDRSVSGSGFSAKFQAIDLTSHCDRTFTSSSGEFIFDFKDFEQNEYCDYRIQITSNKRILLSILNISSPCDYGTLMIKNGPSKQSPGFSGLFGESEICNENPIKQLISQGNRLFLRFRSITNREISFALRYEQYEGGCGGHISGFNGAISTPQYPNKDSHSLRCEWLLAVTPGNKIKFQIIKLDNLDSEDSDGNCSPFSRNFLEIYNKNNEGEEHLIERYCRLETNLLPIISSTNSLNIRFSQHGGSHHLPIFGFLAEFSTICTNILLEDCKWIIKTPSGSRIKLQFHLFRITDTGEKINQNFIRIQQFCLGIAKPIEIISKGNQLTLEFNSINEPENHFWISWNTIGCSGIITQNGSKLIANASEGADFVGEESFRKCIWFVKAPIGFSIQVIIEIMETEQVPKGQKCFEIQPADFNNNEKTRLRDGVQFYSVNSLSAFESLSKDDGNNLPLKAFCGQLKNITFNWGGNSIYSINGLAIIFSYHTDTIQLLTDTLVGAAIFGDGTLAPITNQIVFSAKINFLPISNEINNIIFVDPNSDSFIQSPNYPKPYPRSIELNWRFITPEGFRPTFQILNFTSPVLGTSIFDRRVNSETTISSYSNSSNPNDYICGYHMLYLRENFENSSQNGENLFYGSITQTRYKICKDIRINPIEINIEGLSNTSIVTFRGAPYDQITSDSTFVNQKIQRPIGFRLRIYAKCGGILWVNNKESKIFNTANIGLKLQNNKNKTNNNNICEWILRLNNTSNDDQQQIFVRIEQLYLSTKVEFLIDNEPPQLEFFCGTDSKGIIEALTIPQEQQQHFHEFVCNSNKQAKLVGKNLDKMKLSSFLIICGSQITNNHQGHIALNPINSPIDCEWTINTVKGSHVFINIYSLSLPTSEFCTSSFLEFRENNSSGQLIGRFCGNKLFPSTIENTEGPLYIRLRHKIEELNNNEELIEIKTKMELKYLIVYGQTSSHIIESPPEGLNNEPIVWRIATQDSNNWIQFGFAELSSSITLTIQPTWCFIESEDGNLCLSNNPLAIQFSNLIPPEINLLYTLHSNKATIILLPNNYSKFKIYWKEINPIINGNGTTKFKKK